MFFLWARDAWRLWRNRLAPDWARSHALVMLGVIAAYFPNALFQPVGHMNIVHMMLFFLAGISTALAATYAPRQPRRLAKAVTPTLASPVGNAC